MPNQTLAALCGSLISAAHFPHGLCLTPLYLLFLSPVSSLATSDGCAGVCDAVVAAVVVVVVCGVNWLVPSSGLTEEDDSPLLNSPKLP